VLLLLLPFYLLSWRTKIVLYLPSGNIKGCGGGLSFTRMLMHTTQRARCFIGAFVRAIIYFNFNNRVLTIRRAV
jgi:hypothetical protein